MRSIKCLTCHTVITSGVGVAGCGCDSDAPTWCALDGDRVLKFSYSQWIELGADSDRHQ